MAPRKVAILGGGAASLAAAFELSGFEGWRQEFDVTVYQMGWRLGGKGASGRNLEACRRIEEHGLHILFGFYENAFGLIRRCYRELGRPPGAPLATWEDAFKPANSSVLEEKVGERWVPWTTKFPPNDAVPGDGGELPSPWQYVKMLLELGVEAAEGFFHAVGMSGVRVLAHEVAERVEALLGADLEGGAGGLHGAKRKADAMPEDPLRHAPDDHREIVTRVRAFVAWARGAAEGAGELSLDVRRIATQIELLAAAAVGMIEDGLVLPPHDWTKIDDLDCREWLRKHGASEAAAASPVVQEAYDLIFSHGLGVGAGAALYGGLRLYFTYKGAVLYKMQAGMGDTIFAPLYEVLRRRGVRFEFFHRVDDLEPSRDGTRIEKITIGRQATVRREPYEPLVDVKGLPCWPSAPHYSQLVEGEALRRSGENLENWWTRWQDPAPPRVLEVGKDFDLAVLGISIGAFPYVARQLIERDGRFRAMVENVATTATQAVQLWFRRDLRGLGWTLPPPVLGTYVEPFDTWADMSHLLAREDWPEGGPRNIAYLCGGIEGSAGERLPPRSDHDYPLRQLARVYESARRWLERDVRPLWPAATRPDDPEALDWDTLVDLHGGRGEERLRSQYWIGAWNPSDRYVLSAPGTSRHRLDADETSFENLYLAGDWTRTPFNAGCLEAAVMSGMRAAQAISGRPEEIVGMEPRPRATTRRPYLPYVGETVLAQPFGFRGAMTYGFVLRASIDKLAAILDTYLNVPRGGGDLVYRPLLPAVVLTWVHIDAAGSLDPEYVGRGTMSEKDCLFAIPFVAARRRGPILVAEEAGWHVPLIWVSNPEAVVQGREIYGYPKQQADLEVPAEPASANRFGAATIVVDRVGGRPEVGVRTIVETERADADLGRWESLAHALEWIKSAAGSLVEGFEPIELPGIGLLDFLLASLSKRELPMLFFKQFRDAAEGSLACYQAIVSAPQKVTRLRGAGWLGGEWRVRVIDYESLPIAASLGLEGGAGERGVECAPVFSFWVDYDFTQGEGRVVWRGA